MQFRSGCWKLRIAGFGSTLPRKRWHAFGRPSSIAKRCSKGVKRKRRADDGHALSVLRDRWATADEISASVGEHRLAAQRAAEGRQGLGEEHRRASFGGYSAGWRPVREPAD